MARLRDLRLRKAISRPVQAEMLNNIALMLRSGVAMIDALQEAAASTDSREINKDMNHLIISIQGGTSFSAAARQYPHIFPKSILHLIRIGEETGRLDDMLQNGAEHLKRVHAIVSDTKQALLYPAFVFTVLGAAFVFWMYYVAPKIIGLFEEMEVTLPTLTIWVVTLSDFFRLHLVMLLIGVVITIGAVFISRQSSRRLKKAMDHLLLTLPIIGGVISASILAFITQYFALLMDAGIDLLQAMDILKSSVTNEVYRDKLGEVKASLIRGESITQSFRSSHIFPAYVIRMISVGEMSGNLSEQLVHVAAEYRQRLSVLVSTFGKMIGPVTLVVAGAFFAVIIVGLLLPIYDLVSQVSG
jgi:general secretion pathway protein F/type IV pilus assembly protein PilC